MEDLYDVGGVPGVMKMMLQEELIDGNCQTIAGKTIGEALEENNPLQETQTITPDMRHAIQKTGHLQVFYGNLAPEGAVSKITGKEGTKFTGTARVFDSEAEANDAILDNKIVAGDVVVIRYCGPKGGPGMPELLKPTSVIMGEGLGDKVALIKDGRFSGGTHGFVVGHITPEAQMGGLIALLEDGDEFIINAEENKIEAHLSEEEIEKRRKKWDSQPLRPSKGNQRKNATF